MQLFDTHSHLQDERLQPHLRLVLDRARQAGVSAVLCCGSAESDWPAVRELAARYAWVRPAFGLHPWYVLDRSPGWLVTLRHLLAEAPAAIGEIGLDHALEPETFPAQEEVFVAQLQLAHELGRPVSVHCRQAWGRMLELLDLHGVPPAGLVFHSFSGARDLVPLLVERGAHFSFSGTITRPRNRRGREAAAVVPQERLLIETDAPDLPALLGPDVPVLRDADGQLLSEPAHLTCVLRAVADLRGLAPETLAASLWENSRRLFGI